MSTLKVVNIQHPSAASATLILDSSGNLALPAGSASTPALQGPSDTNTGLFFPAADTIAFAEGGTEALRIDSSGRVGIGTSSPGGLLHVGASGGGVVIDSTLYSELSPPTATNDAFIFRSTNDGTLNFSSRPAAGGRAYRFWRGSNVSMIIDDSGRVGIGVTSPAAPLDLSGDVIVRGANSTIRFKDSGNTTQYLAIYGNSTDANINAGVNNLVFYSAATERARFDGSGRLLVGTSTSMSGGTGALLQLYTSGSSADFVACPGNNNPAVDTDLFRIRGFGQSGASFNCSAEIKVVADANHSASSTAGRLVFSTTASGATSPTERMRIRNDGVVLINTTTFNVRGATAVVGDFGGGTLENSTTFGSQIAGLFIDKTIGASNTAQNSNVLVLSGNSGAASSPGNLIRGYSGNGGTTLNFQVAFNGNVTNTNNSYTAISDISLKENIVDAKSQWSDIKALRVVNYNFKPETGYETIKQLGLIAQEVETVSPDLVQQTILEDGTSDPQIPKALKYSVLYMKAVKALQEAMERIEQLEAEMAEVKAQLS